MGSVQLCLCVNLLLSPGSCSPHFSGSPGCALAGRARPCKASRVGKVRLTPFPTLIWNYRFKVPDQFCRSLGRFLHNSCFSKRLAYRAVPPLFAAKPRVDGIRAVSTVHGSAASSQSLKEGCRLIRFLCFGLTAVASSLRWVLVTAQKPSSLVQPGMVALVSACSIVWEMYLTPSGLQG